MELVKIGENTYYFPCPANIGLYVEADGAVLIDSGNDAEAGRQILKILNEKGIKLKMIVNTHANADHFGGNAYLREKTSCRIASTRIEGSFMSDPILEPSFLYGGFSFLKMRNKFLVGPACNITDEIKNVGKIADTDLQAVPLPGHFFDMIGVLTPDGVFFLADSVFSEKIMDKYHIFFLYDVKSHLEMLNEIKKFSAVLFVPSHAEPTKDIAPLIEKNIAKVNEICAFLKSVCSGKTTEEIHTELCKRYGIALNESQYILTMSSLRSYLTYLSEKGEIKYSFVESRMIWSPL